MEKFEKELEAVEEPTLILHFKVSVDTALERIKRRGRAFEERITEKYMPIDVHVGWNLPKGVALFVC